MIPILAVFGSFNDEELASMQHDKEGQRELINARMRSSYRNKKEGTTKLQDDAQGIPRHAYPPSNAMYSVVNRAGLVHFPS